MIFSESDFKHLIQGLHLIELRFRAEQGSTFGFGSISRTNTLLSKLNSRNLNLATQLNVWIAHNGGNYYIKSLVEKNDEQSSLFK